MYQYVSIVILQKILFSKPLLENVLVILTFTITQGHVHDVLMNYVLNVPHNLQLMMNV